MERVTLCSCHGDFDMFSTCLEIFDTFSTYIEICFQHALKFSTYFQHALKFSTWFSIHHKNFNTVFTAISNIVHNIGEFQNCAFHIFIPLMQAVV